ncbi:MAG: D-cysteine desulfhydrase family protein [Candidatus Marinimicrobia bacterium]|nr:D-cysteine desulfhydrase family protein [Candidatus Neomarinimicrobiota bacterium]
MKKIDDTLTHLERESISLLPTPFYRMNALSEMFERNIYIKRDDMTGFAFGGNKTRKFDFLIADAIEKGCDTIIGIGANQSNFCRILSGVGAKYGLSVHLILSGTEPKELTGNLLLDHLFGATVHHIETTDSEERMEKAIEVRKNLEYAGKRVYFLPPGGSTSIGTLGYIAGWGELMDDFEKNHLKVDKVFHASSSAGTQAGLVAGQAITGWPGEIIGISVDVPKMELEKNVHNLAQAAGDFLNIQVPRSIVTVDESYIGKGYGKQTALAEEAIELFARNEGVLLDHVYTGKAASGLIDYCRSGKVGPDETIVFLHTGGNIQLFE